jgi:uncharacterized protein (TIGR02996 family)
VCVLEAWREKRAPELATLARLLRARLPPRPVVKGRNADERWTAVEAKQDPADVERQIAADFAALKLGERPDDPGIAELLVARLRRFPWRSPSMKKFYEATFALIARIGGERVADEMLELRKWLDELGIVSFRRWMEEQIIATAAAARGRDAVLDEPERVAAAAVETELSHRDQSRVRTQTSTAELLAAVYAAPDDDARRQVLLDHLLETGDPRGEFMALQLAAVDRQLDKKELARMRALLKQNATAWLGSIAHVVVRDEMVFERGFLASCRMQIFEWHGGPEWSTVRALDLRGKLSDYSSVAGRLFPSLREVDNANAETAASIFAREKPTLWTHFGMSRATTDAQIADMHRQGLLRTTALPHVTSLSLRGGSLSPAAFDEIFACPLGQRLQVLRLTCWQPSMWLRAALPASLRRLEISGRQAEWHIDFGEQAVELHVHRYGDVAALTAEVRAAEDVVRVVAVECPADLRDAVRAAGITLR